MTIASIVLLTNELLATEGKEGGLFDFDLTLPLMAVQFLLLMLVLDKVFFTPIGRTIDDRADYLRQQLAQAREDAQKSEQATTDFDSSLRDARRAAAETVAKAQAEAQAVAAERTSQAQAEVQAEREKAAREIEEQKRAALGSLEGDVGSLSQQILEKLLGAELVR